MTFFEKNLNFYFSVIGLSVNFFFSSFILVLAAVYGFFEFAAELGVLKAGIFMICQMLSSNARSIIISKKSLNRSRYFFNFRTVIGLLIFIIFTILIFIINSNYNFLIFILSTLIIIQWISEIIITEYHTKKKYLEKIIFTFFQIFFVFLTFLSLHLKNLFFLEIILILYIFFYLIFFYKYFLVFFLKIHKLRIKENIFSYVNPSLYSSISLNFTNLTWRLMIINSISKELSGALFAGFAFASFIGSFFYNIVGPILFDKKKTKQILRFLIDYILFFLILSVWFIIYFFQENLISSNNIDMFFFDTILISLLGSYFMMKAHYLRFEYFFLKTVNQNIVFRLDIVCSFLIILIVPILFLIGEADALKYSYLASSFLTFIVFFLRTRINNDS